MSFTCNTSPCSSTTISMVPILSGGTPSGGSLGNTGRTITAGVTVESAAVNTSIASSISGPVGRGAASIAIGTGTGSGAGGTTAGAGVAAGGTAAATGLFFGVGRGLGRGAADIFVSEGGFGAVV